MSELEDKLSAILSNPDAMNQILTLAHSLGSGAKQDPPPAASDSEQAQETEPSAPPQAQAAPGGDLFSALGSLDPRLIQLAMRLLSEYQSNDDERAALLNALRPFVKKERYAKLDKAIRISKLTRLIRITLDSFQSKGEEERHV